MSNHECLIDGDAAKLLLNIRLVSKAGFAPITANQLQSQDNVVFIIGQNT